MDFTASMYHQICEQLSSSGRTAITFAELISRQADIGAHDGYIVLRHDVDRMPERALRMAKIEHQHGLTGSYYFRIPASYRPHIIQEIANLGHEIGLHYECLDKAQGRPRASQDDFLPRFGKDQCD